MLCVSRSERERQLLRNLQNSKRSQSETIDSSAHYREGLTFLGESERSLSSSRYELVAFQTKMTEMRRNRKYLQSVPRSQTLISRWPRQAEGEKEQGTHFFNKLYSIQLLAWNPCA